MNRHCRMVCFGTAAAIALSLAAARPALAIGYWNIPGNFCQCFGYGWGPGYHAPLVLGPSTNDGLFAHNVVRLPAAPSSAHAWRVAPSNPAAAATSTYFQPSLLTHPTQPSSLNLPAGPPGPVFR